MLEPGTVLKTLGYDVDYRGYVSQNINQLAVMSLESTEDGGVLRIHGSLDGIVAGETPADNALAQLAFPKRITKKFVYFETRSGDNLRVGSEEFTNNAISAFKEYEKLVRHDTAG